MATDTDTDTDGMGPRRGPGDLPESNDPMESRREQTLFTPEALPGPIGTTKLAYGDNRGHPENGSTPNRHLYYYSGWIDAEVARECLEIVGPYNNFEPEHGIELVDLANQLDPSTKFIVGREMAPVMYIWTDHPLSIASEAEMANPDELAIRPGATSFPGKPADAEWTSHYWNPRRGPTAREKTKVSRDAEGTYSLVRIWWD